jgi:hypothetical protein
LPPEKKQSAINHRGIEAEKKAGDRSSAGQEDDVAQ